MRASLLAIGLAATTLVGFAATGGCGHDPPSNPFGVGGGGASSTSTTSSTSGMPQGGGGAGGSDLGAPCVDDKQCDDGIDCTTDRCDKSVGRCRITPDDTKCQDDLYCNGVERCSPANGCIAGVPVTCSDGDPCTIDVCDEATKKCQHLPRDADGDGDPDVHCGGGDCDDEDPTVNSKAQEICGNGKDDNCNGQIDESPCVSPANDSCSDPLVVDHAGTFAMNTSGTTFDYPTSCGLAGKTNATDVVAALEIPAGAPIDVEVTATVASGEVSVAVAGQCGDPSSEIACGPTFPSAKGGAIARLRARAIGSATEMTVLPIYVETDVPGAVSLTVAFDTPVPKAANETCGTAAPIEPGVPELVEILDATIDIESACVTPLGELVYVFNLDTPADVDVYATSTDGTGLPQVTLRDAGCALVTDELACAYSGSSHLLRHSLAAGTYYVSVSASAPTYVDLDVETSPPTAPPADDSCVGAPVIAPNQTIQVDLARHEDDVNTGCLVGAADAAYDLSLDRESDVLLVERVSSGDTAAVELLAPSCDAASKVSCATGSYSPNRASSRGVPAGDYRVVAESTQGQAVALTAFVRDATPPTVVLFADTCADAFVIPETGGFFQGNTANAHDDYPAGCDQAGTGTLPGPDQILSLTIAKQQRVILDMTGSTYSTLLDVRQGPSCPGAELMLGCAVGSTSSTSFLDLTLDPGSYQIQIDGYGGDAGSWFLDVRIVDP